MENTTSLEQPTPDIITATDNVNEQIINNENVSDQSVNDNGVGSIFGKFKDATSLLNAYNNLEKEFTKKSQKLSELIKQQEATELKDTLVNEPEFISYKQSNWQSEVSKFFEKNPDAKVHAKEIATTLMKDRELAKSQNCLEYAYALAELKNRVKPADLLNDPKHLEDIYANENIKNNIISNYLKGIYQNKNNLRFISGEPKSISPTRSPDKPKTLKEASLVLKKLLQS